MIAHSLAVDHDISLLENYQNKDQWVFYKGPLPKRTRSSADRTRELPTFSLGLPLFLTPFYAMAVHWFPQYLVMFLRLVLCAVTAIALYYLMELGQFLSGSSRFAHWVAAGAAFSIPIIMYSNLMYPEILAFLLLIVALRQLTQPESLKWTSLIPLSLIPGLLVWLHPKYMILSLAICLLTSFRLIRERRAKGHFRLVVTTYAVLAAAGIASLLYYLHWAYGTWSPSRLTGGFDEEREIVDFLRNRTQIVLQMFVGSWLDQRFGILPHSPSYVAFFPALLWCLRERWLKVYPVVLLFVAHMMLICFGAPLGGFAPPARHFLVLTPFLLVPVMLISSYWNLLQKGLFVFLQFLGCGISAVMLYYYPLAFTKTSWRYPDVASRFWEAFHLEEWIPNTIATAPRLGLILAWLGLVAVFSVLLYPKKREVQSQGMSTNEHP